MTTTWQVYDMSITCLQIIWDHFQMSLFGGRSFKNSKFFKEHVFYVTQAVSKCKKIHEPVGLKLCGD